MKNALTRLVGIAVGVAAAVWLVPASIHVVNWPPTGPVRVALLQPLSKFWWSLTGVTLLVGAIGATAAIRGRAAFVSVARALSPLMALWLWLLPFAPWLPDRAPLLLVLAGPLRWAIAAAAIAGTMVSLAAVAPVSWRFWRGTELPGRRAVFAISLAAYLVFGFSSANAIGPGADEPHYLVIAHSLLVDHDLNIENNHARRDYRDFFGGELRPDYLRRGRHGEIYSIHAPGLPALLLPAYAVAGYRGALAFMCLLAALAALAVFDLAEAVAGRAPALVAWAAVCLTVPFVPHAWLIFPEMPGALIVGWALLWLWKPLPDAPAVWLARGIALALLPWLHTKFVVLLAMLAVFLVLRLWLQRSPAKRMTPIAWLLAPIGLSLALWLCSFYWMYGVFDPEAPYGSYAQTFVRSVNIPRGLFGLLFDQKFGLVAYAPVYIFAALGFCLMLRRPGLRAFAIGLALTAAIFVGNTTRLYMWWGGSSAPARFLVPVLPFLAPMIAVAARDLRGVAGRATLGLLLAVSLVVAGAGAVFPERLLLFSDPHGYARLAEAMQGPSPLSLLLPTFTDENWRTPLRMLVPWLVAGTISLLIVVAAARARDGLRPFWAALLVFVVFLLASSVIAGSPSVGARLATANRGQLELMAAYDSPRLRGFDYSRMTRVDENGLLSLATLVARRGEGDLPDPRRLAGPFELPPGRYRSRIWFEGGRGFDGDAVIVLGNRGDLALARVVGPLPNPVEMPFELVVDTGLWLGLTNPAAARTVLRLEVIPARLVPRSERPAVEARAVEPIGGWPGGFIVYVDDNTFPEGGVYWTRATNTGQVLVAPSTASMIVLTLAVGPNGGLVGVRAAGRDMSLEMSPEEIKQITVPVQPGAGLVPIAVTAPGAFRPADVDPRSSDLRRLGCQVRIELK